MKNSDIVHGLEALRPGCEWTLNGNDLKGLIWLDKKQARPTDEELTKAIAAYVPPAPAADLQSQVTALQKQVSALMAAAPIKGV